MIGELLPSLCMRSDILAGFAGAILRKYGDKPDRRSTEGLRSPGD
jgi:hypothetical protein